MLAGVLRALATLASAGLAAGLTMAFDAWGAAVATILVAIRLGVMTTEGSRQWLSRRVITATEGRIAAILAGASILTLAKAPDRGMAKPLALGVRG